MQWPARRGRKPTNQVQLVFARKSRKFREWLEGPAEKDADSVRAEKDRLIAEYIAKNGVKR